jgi:hypothetical protein
MHVSTKPFAKRKVPLKLRFREAVAARLHLASDDHPPMYAEHVYFGIGSIKEAYVDAWQDQTVLIETLKRANGH